MSASTCARCGTRLATSGVCPRCVLELGLASEPPHEPEQLDSPRPGSTGPTAAHGGSSSHGPRFIPPTVAELAPLFPQLELLELLGRGGMGAVYKARQPALDRLVAVKILPAGSAADPAFAERFTREARALARLSHPHIVAVHDFGQAGDLFYFVMEYVEGANLREILRSGEMTAVQALAIVPQMCEALQFAHDEGVVHRDIKPENVLVDRRGRVKIADFGLAKLLLKNAADFTLTSPEQVMGTPHYMAPEQMERPLTVDHRADIYSLGVVFYELLTGELPLGRFAPPSEVAAVDARLDDVVLKTLAKEPSRRYQHASAVRTEVEAIRQTPPLAAAPPPRVPAMPPPAKPAADAIDWPTVTGAVRWPAIGLILVGIAYLAAPFMIAAMFVGFPSGGSPVQSINSQPATPFPSRPAVPKTSLPPLAPRPPLAAQTVATSWLLLLGLIAFVVPITVGGLLILGGMRMLQLQAYPLAVTAAIVAIVTPPGSVALLGIVILLSKFI